MRTTKDIVAKKMIRISVVMMFLILVFFSEIQIYDTQRDARRNAQQVFWQVEQILEENASELEQVQEQYRTTCLNNARVAAYILEHNPAARDDLAELRKIAAQLEVDEIHVFDTQGVIVAGTHPEYIGYSFESGEQIAFFAPLLANHTLELVQDILPNTAEGKLVQYSALWSENRQFILQIGMYPVSVLRATEKNELSYIFSLLRVGTGYNLYALDPEELRVAGSNVVEDVGKSLTDMGLTEEKIASTSAFYAKLSGTLSYCAVKMIGGNCILWAKPVRLMLRAILINDFLLILALVLIAVMLVNSVTRTMKRTIIEPIQRVNEKLRAIQEGDLTTKADIKDSVELVELCEHINSMVDSLLRSSEKLEMSAQIARQKEELERQHAQLEAAVAHAEEANRTKTEFLFNMSHDIRTPMNAILGFTNLAMESEDPDTKQEYLKNIDSSSKQLLDLINNVLEFARIQNRKVLIEEQLVNADEVLDKLRTLFMGDMKNRDLQYTVTRDVVHPYLYMDVTHYTQIALNIMSNAIKYTPDGGSIAVTVRELPGETPDLCYLETVIQDTGIGMSETFLEHAFKSFARERTSTVSGVQGTGLGLSIVKDLAEMMKGTVAIESEQGKGTTVTLRLPHRIGKAPCEEGSEQSACPFDPAVFQGKRILMAEDIDINAMIAMKLLMGKGCIVDRAKDGVECVDKLLKAENGYYDLILMDIQMPNMNGYQATQTIRAFEDPEKANIPIIALTANSFPEDRSKAAEVGMNSHVSKPLDPVKLFKAMAEQLTANASQGGAAPLTPASL